jgi:hypothetical protein
MRDCSASCVIAVATVTALVLPGCGGPTDDLPREPISGTVKFDGQPLETGVITFMSKSAKVITPASAMIRDGSFSIPRESGPVPGTYTVVITANAGAITTPGAAPGQLGKFPKEIIPHQYNTNSTLIQEVKAGADNRFDFDLRK